MRKVGLVTAAAVLILAPWLPMPISTPVPVAANTAVVERGGALSGDGVGGQVTGVAPQGRSFGRVPAGCTCREIVVNAHNEVRDADVETGDAEVVNRSITFISPSYAEENVEVEQDAVARSGDAVAGQVLAVSAADGGGCARVVVNATNDVEDVDVRSGDATARNESVVLVDPGVDRGDLEIKVDQEAVARSGDAVAGQIIGVHGDGGPCGGVILNAVNRVMDADIESGDAEFDNLSEILTCRGATCLDEISDLLRDVDAVRVCAHDECEMVAVDEFIEMVAPRWSPKPTPPPTEEERVEAEEERADAEEERLEAEEERLDAEQDAAEEAEEAAEDAAEPSDEDGRPSDDDETVPSPTPRPRR